MGFYYLLHVEAADSERVADDFLECRKGKGADKFGFGNTHAIAVSK